LTEPVAEGQDTQTLFDAAVGQARALLDERDALRAERDALRVGLKRFGVHAQLCQWMLRGLQCDCGLRALRDGKS